MTRAPPALRRPLPLLAALLVSACAGTRPAPTTSAAPASGLDAIAPGAARAAATIDARELSAHVRFLADDLLEGRGTGERGHATAAVYVATQLQALGVEPAGERGTWFQDVVLRGGITQRAVLEVSAPSGAAVPLKLDTDFVGGVPFVDGTADVTGPLVYVGYGVVAPEFGWDDLAGVDLKGAVALVLTGAPLGTTPDFFPPLQSAVYGGLRTKLEALRARGAVGVIVVHTPRRAEVLPWERAVRYAHAESMTLVENGQVPAREALARATVSMAGLDALLAAAGRSERGAALIEAADARRGKSGPLGTRVHLRTEATLRTVRSMNVVGLLRGAPGSPDAGENVVYTAHLDHLGIGAPEDGDRIYNGASDDAAGVATVLEVAKAFTALPSRPRRGILFLLVTAEEKGLLGSEWFAAHPTVPRASLVANVNSDGGLALWPPKEVVTLGAEESTLREDVARAAAALGWTVGEDPEPRQAHAVRSDQYSFLRAGVPGFATVSGMGPPAQAEAHRKELDAFRRTHYHRAADAWEPTRDFGPQAELARFQFLVGLSIAERPTRPSFPRGSFFLRGIDRP